MKPRFTNQRRQALTLIEVLVIIILLAVLASMCLPVYAARKRLRLNIECRNNLSQIVVAYQSWGNDHGGQFPMGLSAQRGGTKESAKSGNAVTSFQILSNELKSPKFLICPADKNRIAATSFYADFTGQNISYFLGLDADKNNQWTYLSGDDNFNFKGAPVKSGLLELSTNGDFSKMGADICYDDNTRHDGGGNVAFADGRVYGTYDLYFVNYLELTGLATNRLAIP